MEPVEITAGALHLRPWRVEDAPDVYRACQDPDIQRWTTVPSPYPEEAAREFVTEIAPRGWATGAAATFGVFGATSGEALASVGLVRIAAAEGIAEVGFWCAPWARGRGVTTRATLSVCRWGFADLGLARIEWLAEMGNQASRRVAEKAGFTIEGMLRSRLVHQGVRRDAWIGSLLPSDL